MAILNTQGPSANRTRGNTWNWTFPISDGGIRAMSGIVLALLSTGLLTLSTEMRAQAQESSEEYQLKAALLYNFAKFVEWPAHVFPDAATPLRICAIGDDPFGAHLDRLAGKTIRDRALIVQRIRSHEAVTGCHLLYVSPTELTHSTNLLQELAKAPVLTVCDYQACAEAGLMLNMQMADTRVHIEINLDAVQRTSLKVSSQLIKLARIVKGHP